jgi:hypothetical protein
MHLDKAMQRPLIDVLGFTALILSMPWLDWLLHNEPVFRAFGSFGAAVIVVWRLGVLARRTALRLRARTPPDAPRDKDDGAKGTS